MVKFKFNFTSKKDRFSEIVLKLTAPEHYDIFDLLEIDLLG